MSSIKELINLHSKLVTRFKEYETATGELPSSGTHETNVVVLNEMRYALRATVKILDYASFDKLNQEQQNGFDAGLQESLHALRNAYHDLVDNLLIIMTGMMDELIKEHPVATINILGEKRLKILSDINEVEKIVAKSRGKKGHERQDIYDTEIYDNWFYKLVEHYKFVDQVALPDIIREHDRLEKEEISSNRKFVLMLALAILGIAITIF